MKIITLDQIKLLLKNIDTMTEIEQAFIAYSKGHAVVPPPGELIFQSPPGDVHIKCGYIKNDGYYVIKVASGFYENYKLNLPSSNGLMLVFHQKNGELAAILLDEGYLTDLRTAIAGAIVAKYFAPKKITSIGIVGTGIQARFQLQYLKTVINCRDVTACGRTKKHLESFKFEMNQEGFSVTTTENINELTDRCNLIITTTPSSSPLLMLSKIKHGTHITAVGADSASKQEIDENIFKKSDIVVCDSISQCIERGDTAHAIKNRYIEKTKLIELGNAVLNKSTNRKNDQQITVADLTGLAVQDIAIANAVMRKIENECL